MEQDTFIRMIQTLNNNGISLNLMSKYYGIDEEELLKLFKKPVKITRGRKLTLDRVSLSDLRTIFISAIDGETEKEISKKVKCSTYLIQKILTKPILEKEDTDLTVISPLTRGEICYYTFPKIGGHIQYGTRPCIVVSNDMQNNSSEVVLVVPITSSNSKKNIPVHVRIKDGNEVSGIVLCEQIISVQKYKLRRLYKKIDNQTMDSINQSLQLELSIDDGKIYKENEKLQEQLMKYKLIILKLQQLRALEQQARALNGEVNLLLEQLDIEDEDVLLSKIKMK